MLFLNKIPQKCWVILACFLGTGGLIVCTSVAIAITKSSNFSFSTGGTSLSVDAKKIKDASNNTEYTAKVLEDKLSNIQETIEQLENSNNPEVREFVESVRAIEPVVAELERNNEELRSAVKEVE